VLFTTFTRNLAEAIERDVRDLGGTDALERIEVLNVDRLAYRIVRDAEGHGPVVVGGPGVRALWQDVADDRAVDLGADFLATEWEQVVLAHGCASRDDYLTVSRAGRGVRLDRRQRAEVWKAVEAFNRRLVDTGRRTSLQLCAAAEGYLRERSVKPYRHVVVDEGQDLHQVQWRMLRAAVPEQADDLFVVGDSHQRIYDRHSSLSKVGIDIRGRGRKLRLNYRTTHEILAWSLALLGEARYDDLDEGTDSHDFAGYHSLVHGPRPVAFGARSTRQQLQEMARTVRRWIESGVHEEDIGVAAREASSFEPVQRALREEGVYSMVLGAELAQGIGVRVGTMHRFKGLEFRCVAVVDCDDDSVQRSQDVQRERCVLYVACTRAREDLWVGWSGTPSRFLDPVR
jgi:superfamily I DNA/RNA helicase